MDKVDLEYAELTQQSIPQVILESVQLPTVGLRSLEALQVGVNPFENEVDEAKREVESGATALEENNVFDPVKLVYDNLGAKEGVGDTLTDVPTGTWGVTANARSAVNAPDEMPDEDVAREYLGLLNRQWGMRQGYDEAPEEIKAMLLDASYNMGEQTMNFPELAASLAAGDYDSVAKELLDTANVDNMAVKGLAKRRAQSYNLYARPDQRIHSVEQLKDGTLIYRGEDGDELFSYRAKGGKHPKSQAGRIDL